MKEFLSQMQQTKLILFALITFAFETSFDLESNNVTAVELLVAKIAPKIDKHSLRGDKSLGAFERKST